MPLPITHFLWGYMISRQLSKKEDHIIIGLAASVVLDLPYLFDLSGFHRLSSHNLLFILILSTLLFAYLREFKAIIVVLANLVIHLVLDMFATNSPVLWFYPFSEKGYLFPGPYPAIEFLMLQSVLTVIPTAYIIYRYFRYGENPFDLLRYLVNIFFSKRDSAGS